MQKTWGYDSLYKTQKKWLLIYIRDPYISWETIGEISQCSASNDEVFSNSAISRDPSIVLLRQIAIKWKPELNKW